MNKIFLSITMLLLTIRAGAQITAITEEGKSVILFGNGTWCYLNDSVKTSTLDLPHFSKPKNSNGLLKGKKNKYEICYRTDQWKLLPDTVFKDADYALEHREGDLMAMIITQRMQIPLIKIKESAIESFRKNNTEFKISEEQKIMVNGSTGLLLKIDALVDGIPVSYLNGYFSTGEGTFQLITYTGYNLFDHYRNDMMEFISGFVATGE
jgi:hypothetical protein